MRRIVIIEEDGGGNIRPYRYPIMRNPIDEGWICPYCGKRVYSMEVHKCYQPTCSNEFIYEENHPEHGPYCWNYGGNE